MKLFHFLSTPTKLQFRKRAYFINLAQIRLISIQRSLQTSTHLSLRKSCSFNFVVFTQTSNIIKAYITSNVPTKLRLISFNRKLTIDLAFCNILFARISATIFSIYISFSATKDATVISQRGYREPDRWSVQTLHYNNSLIYTCR